MFVLGTAGHIDHGKSALIMRLTGIDPDRLPEEKARGMTIDIGFAYLDLPGGRRIGIIDVPGHERFVRNMIAGVGGIDAVILVVAADDGWMPQSQEHLQIIKLLGIKYGVIALTKVDLVDQNWADLVEEDIRDKVKGSFLENAPLVRLSSVTGAGFESLKDEITKLADNFEVREDIGKPRLYIDRSFVLSGMGGVVAGTLRGGKLKMGQDVAVFPSCRIGKVRIIQSHDRPIESAEPGQRTSISLTGIDKEFLGRGCVITSPELIEEYPDPLVLALRISVLPESAITVDNRRRLLMILGTTEAEGEVRLYHERPIGPSEEGIIFFRPKQPVLAFTGDKCIFRLPTPQLTMGGGIVLDVMGKIPHKKEIPAFKYLEDRISLSGDSLVQTEFAKSLFVDKGKDFLRCNYSRPEIDGIIGELEKSSVIDRFEGRYYRISDIAPIAESVTQALKNYFETHSHLDGAPIDIVASQLKKSAEYSESILDLLVNRGQIVKKKNRYDLPSRSMTVRGEIKEAADAIERELLKGGYSPPAVKELVGENKVRKEALDYLIAAGKARKVGGALVFYHKKWEEIVGVIRELLASGDSLTVGELKDRTGCSRKYAVPILEETDRLKITARQGDIRVKGEDFEKE